MHQLDKDKKRIRDKQHDSTNSSMIGIASITNELISKKKGRTRRNATKTAGKAVGRGGWGDGDRDQDKNKDKNKIDHDEWLYEYLTKLDNGIINDQEKWDVKMPNRDTIDNIVNSSNNRANYSVVCPFNTNKNLNGIRTNDLIYKWKR